MQDRKGGCLCGAVRYVLKGDPRAIAICHCTHCQRQSGSLFSFNLVIGEAGYEQSGETMVYVDKGDSGQPVYRHFCGRCGSPVLAKTALAPGKVVVKAGTLDNMEGLQSLPILAVIDSAQNAQCEAQQIVMEAGVAIFSAYHMMGVI